MGARSGSRCSITMSPSSNWAKVARPRCSISACKNAGLKVWPVTSSGPGQSGAAQPLRSVDTGRAVEGACARPGRCVLPATQSHGYLGDAEHGLPAGRWEPPPRMAMRVGSWRLAAWGSSRGDVGRSADCHQARLAPCAPACQLPLRNLAAGATSRVRAVRRFALCRLPWMTKASVSPGGQHGQIWRWGARRSGQVCSLASRYSSRSVLAFGGPTSRVVGVDAQQRCLRRGWGRRQMPQLPQNRGALGAVQA